ncbi:MAG: ATP-binding cassette domain-containing protein [Deltaproteobacteria bacterium]|nr:ATP-binding cassette domain-containing protein [Deltaproteobacteria bacterium]
MSTVLAFDGVRVQRGGQEVLRVPRLELGPGLTVITGANGAGKSTLLLAAAGLIDLAAGSISWRDRQAHRGRAPAPRWFRRELALVDQEPLLLSHRVRDEVTLGLRLRGWRAPGARGRADSILAALGLEALADRPTGRLSGGERQLVALARAAVLETPVLILDEVDSGLDPAFRGRVETLLSDRAAAGCLVLLATHARPASDLPGGRVLEIRAGNLPG